MSYIYYVDTSVLVTVMFKETGYRHYRKLIRESYAAITSSLTEAELYSVARREKIEFKVAEIILDQVSLVFPDRSLKGEYQRVFSKGNCRGADLHHIACALYVDSDAENIRFLTSDQKQMNLARKVGFLCV